MNVISGDEDAYRNRTTLEVMDSKPDTTGGTAHPDGCELSNDDKESWAAEIPGYLMDDIYPMDILQDSSHRDGSIYSDTPSWKREFRIADRNESKQSVSLFLLFHLLLFPIGPACLLFHMASVCLFFLFPILIRFVFFL